MPYEYSGYLSFTVSDDIPTDQAEKALRMLLGEGGMCDSDAIDALENCDSVSILLHRRLVPHKTTATP
jgi:hypothetical protein